MTKPENANNKASSAAKVVPRKAASKAARSSAASALTQKTKSNQTSTKVSAATSKILREPRSSKAAKSAAAAALTQKTSTGFIIGRKAFASISAVEGIYPSARLIADLRRLDGRSATERQLVLAGKYGRKK